VSKTGTVAVPEARHAKTGLFIDDAAIGAIDELTFMSP